MKGPGGVTTPSAAVAGDSSRPSAGTTPPPIEPPPFLRGVPVGSPPKGGSDGYDPALPILVSFPRPPYVLHMVWVALSVALAAIFAAGLAYREASRSSSRKLARTVHEALEDLEVAQKKLRRDWDEERDRLTKQARRTGAAVKRFAELIEEDDGSSDGDEDADVPRSDARGGTAGRVPPVRQNVATLPWRAGRTG